MIRKATPIVLMDEDKKTLEIWVRSSKTEQRIALRVRTILAAAKGISTRAIAREQKVRPATVSKWRTRFAQKGLSGLTDAPCSGAPRCYTKGTERRILAKLDEAPPSGYATWSGTLLAKALGDVSADFVWSVLRRYVIHLQRRRSWCVSTDPEFAAKAADIVGLSLDPPDNAVVLCVDEKPSIQVLERAQGYLKLPNGRALMGFGHEYKRHGTATLFGALNIASGMLVQHLEPQYPEKSKFYLAQASSGSHRSLHRSIQQRCRSIPVAQEICQSCSA